MAVRVAGAAVGLVAGVLLVIGPVRLWASVSADPSAFAAALHEEVSVILPAIEESTGTYTWIQGGAHGDVALLAGVTALVLSASSLRRPTLVRGALLIGLGFVAGWLALADAPDLGALREDAVSVVAPWAQAVQQLPEVLRPVFVVTRGPGTTIVFAGALAAVIGGILIAVAALVSEEDEADWTPWARFHPHRGQVLDPKEGR